MDIRGWFDTGSGAGSLLAASFIRAPRGARAGTDAPDGAFDLERRRAVWQQPTQMALGRADQPNAWTAVRPLIE